jgi:hypothetical protein
MDNPGFLERATIEDDDEDDYDCPGPCDYYRPMSKMKGRCACRGVVPGGRVELPTKGL